MIQSIAPVATASRMFGVTKEQAAVVMLKGHELGLGLASAFEFIHVIDSKPSISPKGMLALIHQSGLLEEMKIEDGKDYCEVYMKRRGGFAYTCRFSDEDAESAGLLKPNSAWDKYRPNMRRWRAVGYCADIVFPDIGGGLYRPEELGANVNENGEPVASWEVVNPPPTPPKNESGNGRDEPSQASDVPIEAKPEPVSEMPAPEAQPQPVNEMPEVRTAADILAAGFDVSAIQATVNALKADGQDVHFPPATSEECMLVMAKLQEAKEDA